jgi:hypothetical protein
MHGPSQVGPLGEDDVSLNFVCTCEHATMPSFHHLDLGAMRVHTACCLFDSTNVSGPSGAHFSVLEDN